MNKDFYNSYFEVEKKHWLMRVRRKIVFDNLKFYFDKKNSQINILDFGCGSGILIGELQKCGYNAFGVDISEEAVKFGASKKIQNLSVLNSKKIDFPDNHFDCVLALDVLEHLEEESWAVKEINRILKPGGVFIIMVPAYLFLWGVQDEIANHYRRYTLTSLKKEVMGANNFKILKSTYFNTFLFAPIALVRIFSRVFQLKKRQSDFDINNAFFDKIFFVIFNLERKLLSKIRFPFGVSILLVLQKK